MGGGEGIVGGGIGGGRGHLSIKAVCVPRPAICIEQQIMNGSPLGQSLRPRAPLVCDEGFASHHVCLPPGRINKERRVCWVVWWVGVCVCVCVRLSRLKSV